MMAPLGLKTRSWLSHYILSCFLTVVSLLFYQCMFHYLLQLLFQHLHTDKYSVITYRYACWFSHTGNCYHVLTNARKPANTRFHEKMFCSSRHITQKHDACDKSQVSNFLKQCIKKKTSWNNYWKSHYTTWEYWANTNLSRTTTEMPFTGPLRKMEWTSSMENPATLVPLIWRIWSPNRKPARAAGEPFITRLTNTPLLMACTLTPTFPEASLQTVSCNCRTLTFLHY